MPEGIPAEGARFDAHSLVAECERRDIELSRRAGKLICRAPAGALDDELRAAITRLKPDLLALLEARERQHHGGDEGAPPLSRSQQRIHALATLLPDHSAAGNISLCFRIRGALDPEAFARTLAAIVRRHEALRACAGPEGQLIVHREVSVALVRHDLRALPEAEREREQDRHIAAELTAAFDLERAPLLRSALLRLGDEDWIALLVTHVFAFDGRSTPLLLDELGRGYGDVLAGREPLAGPLPPRYSDFTRRQRREHDAATLADQRRWWVSTLAGVSTPKLEQGPTREHARRDLRCGHVPVHVPPALARTLEALARGERVTLFHVLLAAWMVVLRDTAKGDSLGLGTIVSSRRGVDAEGMIGSFSTNMLLHTEFPPGASFSTLLAALRDRARSAFGRLDVDFESLLPELEPTLRLHPPFRAMFVLHQSGAGAPAGLRMPGLTVEAHAVDKPRSPYLLDLELGDAGGELRGSLTHGLRRVSTAAAEELAARYLALLERVSADATLPLASLAASGPGGWRPASDAEAQDALAPVPPASQGGPAQGPLETRIAAIWSRLLDLDELGRDADFFDLGGHSLLALAMLRTVEDALGPLEADALARFAAHPSVATLATTLSRKST